MPLSIPVRPEWSCVAACFMGEGGSRFRSYHPQKYSISCLLACRNKLTSATLGAFSMTAWRRYRTLWHSTAIYSVSFLQRSPFTCSCNPYPFGLLFHCLLCCSLFCRLWYPSDVLVSSSQIYWGDLLTMFVCTVWKHWWGMLGGIQHWWGPSNGASSNVPSFWLRRKGSLIWWVVKFYLRHLRKKARRNWRWLGGGGAVNSNTVTFYPGYLFPTTTCEDIN